LADTAVLLAGDEQRVDDASAVVDCDHALQLDLSRVRVDPDDRHVRTEWERRAPGLVVVLEGELVGHVGGPLGRVLHRGRELGPRQAAPRAPGGFADTPAPPAAG